MGTPSIFIGTPTTGTCTPEHCRSAVKAAANLASRGIEVEYLPMHGYNVAMQRDIIAARFLQSKATHLLMWDSDLSAPNDLPYKLLSFGKRLIGAIYPHRVYVPQLIEHYIKSGMSGPEAITLAHRYAVEMDGVERVGELLKVKAVGAGFVLIARECFEAISKTKKLPTYRMWSDDLIISGYFPWTKDATGAIVPEDWSFCHSYNAAGGNVWALPCKEIGHIGKTVHHGDFAKLLEINNQKLVTAI